MLVLTRGKTQQVIIDNGQITVTILEVRGGRVRLGIEAPSTVAVRRQEISGATPQSTDASAVS